MKKIFIFFIVLSFAVLNQSPLIAQTNPKNLKNAVIISLKAGYHFSDKIDDAEYGFSGGMVYDVSAEFHIGKGWFMGANYDYWKAEDELTDFRYGHVKREVKGEDFSFTFRYRLFLKNIAFNVGLGLGSSFYRNNIIFSGFTNKYKNTMFNINARFGIEYFASKNVIVVTEASALTAGELKFDVGGGSSRSNSLFQLKAGIGYILRK